MATTIAIIAPTSAETTVVPVQETDNKSFLTRGLDVLSSYMPWGKGEAPQSTLKPSSNFQGRGQILGTGEPGPIDPTSNDQTVENSVKAYLQTNFGTSDPNVIRTLMGAGAQMMQALQGPPTLAEFRSNIPKMTVEEIDAELKSNLTQGHTEHNYISACTRAANPVNEDRYAYTIGKGGFEFATVGDGHGGGRVSDYVVQHLNSFIEDRLTQAEQTIESFRGNDAEVRKVIDTALGDFDEKILRETLFDEGCVATGTIHDTLTNKLYTWGVGDCTNIGVFRDKVTGKLTVESLIDLHAKGNDELEQHIKTTYGNVIDQRTGRWGGCLAPWSSLGDRTFKPDGDASKQLGVAMPLFRSVRTYDYDNDGKTYLGNLLTSDGVDFGVRQNDPDAVNKMIKAAEELFTGSDTVPTSAIDFMKSGMDPENWVLKNSKDTRSLRDDQTAL